MKKIEIIPIARKKLARRGISEDWVKETINNPAQLVQGYGGRKVAQRKYMVQNKEYLLRVVFEDREESCDVVTGYLTTQIDRYWEEK
jgi:hypothetical protein